MPNAKVLESKKAIVDELTGKIQGASAVVFVDYKGINVAQDTDLRKQFRDASVDYSVVKNTLTRFAANKAGYSQFDELLNGTTAMACTTGDPIAPARIVCEFAKKNKNVLSIKGGLVEGSVLTAEQLNSFGELPSKDALIAQVLGTFPGPHFQPGICSGPDPDSKGRPPLPRGSPCGGLIHPPHLLYFEIILGGYLQWLVKRSLLSLRKSRA